MQDNGSGAVLLASVFRGGNIESEHFGHISVANAAGEILFSLGNAAQNVHMRSSAKPFQALPALRDGVGKHFDFARQELALACASHNGEPLHREIAAAILRKAGLDTRHLQCGIHRPIGVDIAAVEDNPPWSVLENNCSGKHGVMLAACVKNNWPVDNYLDPQHPYQQRIRQTISEMASIAPEHIAVQIDGCSAPEFALPLRNVATAYANLAALPSADENPFDLMADYAYMVAGKNRFDTAIMTAMGGKLIAKTGAEGLECMAIRGKMPIGIAISIADGNGRATPPVALKILKALGLVNSEMEDALAAHARPLIYNHRKIEVGYIESQLDLPEIRV